MTEITKNTADSGLNGGRVGRAAMLHDWLDLAMTHFAIDPRILQPHIPLPLDTFRGLAYITLVPFRLANIRCPRLPGLTRALLRPVSDHRLLNVRTYVKAPHCEAVRGSHPTPADTGIYFLCEFTDHRLNSVLAPLLYGTPYRHAHLVPGSLTTREGALRYEITPYLNTTSAALGTLDHFLLERYAAWCSPKPAAAQLRRGRLMRFDIDHPPWRFRHAAVRYHDTSLLARTFPWFNDAVPVTSGGAHVCLPLTGVRISFPKPAFARRHSHDELHAADLRALRPH